MSLLSQRGNCVYCATVQAGLSRLQVSFLVDVDKGLTMYESDAIVEYLQKTYGNK